MGRLLKVIVGLALLLASLWSASAIWVDGPASRPLAGLLAAAAVLSTLWLTFTTKGWRRLLAWLPFVAVLMWWNTLQPSNTRDWTPDVAELPHVDRDGDILTFHNVRNLSYGKTDTDYTPRWETRQVDLSKLKGVNLFMSFWGPTLYAHTIMSWEFEGAPPIAVSIETRKQRGEEYSAVLGFFRQFELYYVVADERDVIGVRTNYRGEHVRLLRLNVPPEKARALLLQYVDSINALYAKPAWYNAFTTNCTTTIMQNAKHLAPIRNPFDWRILANGYLDERLYELGTIDNTLPLTDLRVASEITEKAKAAGMAADFSQRIRVGVPGLPKAEAAKPARP